MNKLLEKTLLQKSEENQTKGDSAHDFQHAFRVYQLAKKIGEVEHADFDVLIPAALFHDLIVYKKNDPKSKNETNETAELATSILRDIKGYPQKKIARVVECILQCSYSKGIMPTLLESKILQDADRLEATGAISIMRTFSSGGQMQVPFYDPADPFCKKGSVAFRSSIDLFYRRLLLVEKGMHTKLAKRIAKRRTIFLKTFLAELKLELKESGVTV